MPKLSSAAAKIVDGVEARHESGGNFEPLAPGRYLAQLSDVTVQDPNKYGAAVWSAEFHQLVIKDVGFPAPGRQWYRLTLPSDPKKGVPSNYNNGADKWEKYQAMLSGLLKGFFHSFGYTVDSDTDELIGEWVELEIGVRTIQSGPREGEQTNEVKGIYPVPEDYQWPAGYGPDSNGNTDDDEF